MNGRIEERLKALAAEYETGKRMAAELDAKRADLFATMLRIEGAMQVLRELREPAAVSERDVPAPNIAQAR